MQGKDFGSPSAKGVLAPAELEFCFLPVHLSNHEDTTVSLLTCSLHVELSSIFWCSLRRTPYTWCSK